MKKPTLENVQKYLNLHNPLGLKNAELSVINEHNHLIYKATNGGESYAIRMINPESYRTHEWIEIGEEYEILIALGHTGLGPKAYYLDMDASPPLLIQEFVEAECFKKLKPLSEEHLRSAAHAIAYLNKQKITPEQFPFMKKYVGLPMRKQRYVWYFRLFDAIRRKASKNILKWAAKITPIASKASDVLAKLEKEIPAKNPSFHFDGAHAGNTYYRYGRTMFLDWQKVSWRDDPAYTLVRFATSVHTEDGIVPRWMMETLIGAYLKVNPIVNFSRFAYARLLERQVSDLVWVLWDYARRKDKRPVEQATSVTQRYEEVRKMLEKYK